ncbi:MAG TPA: branched-chain amino acid transporter AzlD [Bacteroides graminisolvens]|jgi:Predicted branched-chain amino acid permeases (azaleucine resistance)|uniref:Branched-chain amino acid transporter AzlD n=1 Tax=Bacteroides graminisolvens TaxID=477666 RepID=A0A3D2SIJ0_9BACE|nr:branched-chain amino acid transporter permease [Bacteroides graminisolvens]HCK25320.1 branched-chain amino acid transporter AzlD [Bacteroides graminisolvens]
MSTTEQIITIAVMAIAVIATRFLPFLIFTSRERTPHFVRFLGKYLASAVFGMLIIYCMKDVQLSESNHAIPQLLGILVCVVLHLWRKNMLLTIAGGTLFYMLLVQNL